MAVEPQVFIAYGRPDKDVAQQLAAEFWRNRIECYNYMSKPVEDRIGRDIDHRGYIYATRLFIAILSDESNSRFLVAEEIAIAHQIATTLNERLYRVYISLMDRTRELPFPKPNLVIYWYESQGPASIVSDLLERMGPEFLDRNQKAWEINKNLYSDKWEELNQLYSDRQNDA